MSTAGSNRACGRPRDKAALAHRMRDGHRPEYDARKDTRRAGDTTRPPARENWLLVYEANIKGWLPNRGGVDPVGADAHFSYLKQSGVEFLDLTTPMDSPPYTAERAYEPDPLLSLI